MTLPANFSFVWKKLVAGSAHPGVGQSFAAALTSLQNEGVGAIVSMTERSLDFAMLREFGFNYLHLPVEDFTAPQLTQIERAVEFMQKENADGRGVLVHCQAGIGRTGTILACYRVAQGEEPAQAIAAVRGMRPGSLEVQSQEIAVLQFARHWRELQKRRKD